MVIDPAKFFQAIQVQNMVRDPRQEICRGMLKKQHHLTKRSISSRQNRIIARNSPKR